MLNSDEINSRLQAASKLLCEGEYIAAEREFNAIARAIASDRQVFLPAHEMAKLHAFRGRCLIAMGLFSEALPLIDRAIAARKKANIVDASYFDLLFDQAAALRGECRSVEAAAVLAEIRAASGSWATDLGDRITSFERQLDAIRLNKSWGPEIRPGLSVGELLGSSDINLRPALRDLSARVLRLVVRPIDRYRLHVDLEFSVDNEALVDRWPGGDLPIDFRPLLFAFFLPRGSVVSSDGFSIALNDPDPAWETSFFFADNGFHTVFLPDSYHRFGARPLPLCKSYKYVQGQSTTFHGRLPPRARVSFSGVVDYAPNSAFSQDDRRFLLQVMLPFGHTVLDPQNVTFSSEHPVRVGRTRFRDDRTPSFIPERNDATIFDVVTPDLPRVGREEAFMTNKTAEKVPIHLMLGDVLTVEVERPKVSSLAISVKPMFSIIPTGFASLVQRTESLVNDDQTVTFQPTSSKLPLVRCIAENGGSLPRDVSLKFTCAELGVVATKSIKIDPGDRQIIPVDAPLPEPVPAFLQTSAHEDTALSMSAVALVVAVTDNETSATYSFDVQALPPDYAIWGITNGQSGSYEDLRSMIGRWVTPDDPLVGSLLQQFLPQGPTSPEADLRLIYAGLCGLNFVYDNSRLVFGARMNHHYQRVRFPAVSLRHHRINCIDATVLLASFVEAAGHQAAVTFVPGHAYLCVVDQPHGRMIALESTGLCVHWRVNDEKVVRTLTFEEAAQLGRETTERFSKRLFPSESKPDSELVTPSSVTEDVGMPPYRFLRISAMRDAGITPFRT